MRVEVEIYVGGLWNSFQTPRRLPPTNLKEDIMHGYSIKKDEYSPKKAFMCIFNRVQRGYSRMCFKTQLKFGGSIWCWVFEGLVA